MWELVLTYEERRVRACKVVLLSVVVCVCVCMHTSHRHVLVKVCLHQGMWRNCVCFCLLTVNGGMMLKLEPVWLLQVRYLSTWLALLSSVTACRANSMDWLNSAETLQHNFNNTEARLLPDRSVLFMSFLFSRGLPPVWCLVRKVAGSGLCFRFQVPASRWFLSGLSSCAVHLNSFEKLQNVMFSQQTVGFHERF